MDEWFHDKELAYIIQSSVSQCIDSRQQHPVLVFCFVCFILFLTGMFSRFRHKQYTQTMIWDITSLEMVDGLVSENTEKSSK